MTDAIVAAFEASEYAGRLAACRRALAARGLDALLIFAQESQYYLFGYDGGGYVFFQCTVLTTDAGPSTLLCRRPDVAQARDTSTIEEIRVWLNAEDADPAAQLRDILAEKGLTGARVVFPMVSVGATENALIAATLAKGTSELVNVAREPEIMDLAECLNAMGARITGHGTDMITVEGVESLGDAEHAVIPDRIEAGTFAIAALITGGDLTLTSARPRHLDSLLEILKDTGAAISVTDNSMRIAANGVAKAADITTDPYPGFPTDLQAQFMALMCLAEGPSRISETVFENRFMHVPELMRMGADIRVDGGVAIVKGQKTLTPAPVMATDLRASVSLVLAALATEGTSEVSRIYHLDRGYSDLEAKLGACGARMKRVGD